MTKQEKILGLASELEKELLEAINNEEWNSKNEKDSMLSTLNAISNLEDDIKQSFTNNKSKRKKVVRTSLTKIYQ